MVTLYSYDLGSVRPEEAGMPVPKDHLKIAFWVAEGVDKTIQEWLAEGKNSPGQIVPPVVLSQNEVALGGKQGLAELTESDGRRHISYYVAIGSDRVFVINAFPADSDDWPQFEPVLNSVRLPP